MTWQHPFVTIDQNQPRHADALALIVDECRRDGLQILLPDGAFLEFSKSGFPLDTARRSLQPLAAYREIVCSARKLSEMMREELQNRQACTVFIEDHATKCLRTILAELERSDETTLRKLVDGPLPVLMPPALMVWNNHDENKRMIKSLHDLLKTDLPAAQLKAFRQRPEEAVSQWLPSPGGMRFVFDQLKERVTDELTALRLMVTPSVNAAYLSAMAGLAVQWLAQGGLATARSSESSGDLNDVEYVVLGALSRSLATADVRAQTICHGVAVGLEAMRSLAHMLLSRE